MNQNTIENAASIENVRHETTPRDMFNIYSLFFHEAKCNTQALFSISILYRSRVWLYFYQFQIFLRIDYNLSLIFFCKWQPAWMDKSKFRGMNI